MIMASARDLISIFIALELLSIPAYLLAAWRKRDLKGNEALPARMTLVIEGVVLNAEPLSKEVEREGYHATFPVKGATAQQLRSNLETQLKNCDAVVVVYGQVEVDWVSQQLMQSTKALGDRAGIRRYGSAKIPMDETLTEVALDASNRPYLIWKVNFSKPKLGSMDTELFKEWFQAFAQHAGLTLHVETLYGENSHHIAESCFKGLARALRASVALDPREAGRVPSTKGAL